VILIVGSNHSNTAVWAEKNGLGQSVLFTGSEWSPVCHTSLADCPDLDQYVDQFDQIYWAESNWQEFESYKEYFENLFLLKQLPNTVNISNQDPCYMRQTYRIQNSKDHIIFLGCSHTNGQGLDNPTSNYVNQVSQHFNKIPLNLSKRGCGNFRSFEQFNQIEFVDNQIVVLQLTDIARLKYFDDDNYQTKVSEHQMHNITNRSYFDVYHDKQLVYMLLTQLNSVIKYSREKKLRFVFFNLGGNTEVDIGVNLGQEYDKYKKFIEYYLLDYPEYIPRMLSQAVDRGNDGYHYGPKSHESWANSIIKQLEK